METITYVGENLFIGNLGKFFVVLSLISALLSGVFYLRAKEGKNIERNLGRFFYALHSGAVLGIFITLFAIVAGTVALGRRRSRATSARGRRARVGLNRLEIIFL